MKKYVAIELDKTRNLRFGMQALMRIEDKLNKPFASINFEKEMKYSELSVIIWAGLVHEEPELTPESVANLIDEFTDIQTAMEKVGEAMTNAFKKKE